MEKTVLFSLGVVFCVAIGFVSAKKVSKADVSITQTDRRDYPPGDKDVNREFHFSGSELADRAVDEICYTRPCKNGGTCGRYGRCTCPTGTKGEFCEEIVACSSMCEDRLEMDCLYNENKLVAYCGCKNRSLFYDQEAGICKPCPCENGFCGYDYSNSKQKLVCYCHHGYQEFNGYCRECECGFGAIGQCEFDSNGEKICKCYDGFFERGGHCHYCRCMSESDMNTKCEVTGNMKRCFCPEGYHDVLGKCEISVLDHDPCETNNTCHPSTKCYNVVGDIRCECPVGYEGINGSDVEPGEVCTDINECLKHDCWHLNRQKCVNLPGSYKCECLPGYEPLRYHDTPQETFCVATSINVAPSIIVTFTTLSLIIVLRLMHNRMKKRAIRSH